MESCEGIAMEEVRECASIVGLKSKSRDWFNLMAFAMAKRT